MAISGARHKGAAARTMGTRSRARDAAGAMPKALRVLEAVAARARPLAIAELATMLGLSLPTAHRIVTALEGLGFVAREPGKRRIVEGNRLVSLGLAVVQVAVASVTRHAILESLANKTGESCNLGVMAGGNVLYVDRVESHWPLGLRFETGSRVPLHCTAIGKLMLGQLPENSLDDGYLSSGQLTRYTPTTITDPRRLRKELQRVRNQGYSTDNQEFMSGVVCVAVPVRGPNGKAFAGVAISAAEARLTLAGVKRFLPDLRAAAAKLSRSLTGDGAAA